LKYVKGRDLSPYRDEYWYFPILTRVLYEEIGPKIRSQKYLTYEDLAMVYLWKALLWRLRDGTEGKFQKIENSAMSIKNVTRQIFGTNHYDMQAVSELIDSLVTLVRSSDDKFLSGVPLRVASTILSVTDPALYGVVDTHVLSALEIPTEDTTARFVEAIFKMRVIAQEQTEMSRETWTARDVDKALWVLGRK
jgi:hypothetical protein